MVEVDFSDHVLRNIYRIQEGSRLSGTSQAKKKLPPLALGAPLILMRIVYYAIGAIHHLPPPLPYDHTITFYPRANVLRSPVKKRERERQHKDGKSSSKEEVVEPLRMRMRGAVKPMPVPPKKKTPLASPTRSLPHMASVSPSVNVDDYIDLNMLGSMLDKENEAASAQWSERLEGLKS